MSNSLEDILATTVSAQKGHGASNLGAFAAVGPLISDDEEWGDMYVRVERLLHLVPLYATAFIGKFMMSGVVINTECGIKSVPRFFQKCLGSSTGWWPWADTTATLLPGKKKIAS